MTAREVIAPAQASDTGDVLLYRPLLVIRYYSPSPLGTYLPLPLRGSREPCPLTQRRSRSPSIEKCCPPMEGRVRSRKVFLVTTLCPWVCGCVLLASESRGVVYQQEGSVPYRLHPQKVFAQILGTSTPFRHSGHTLGCSSHPRLEQWGCPEPRVTYPFRHPGHLAARCPHLGGCAAPQVLAAG